MALAKRHSLPLVDTMLRCLARASPDRSLNHPLHLAALLVDLCKHEALKLGGNTLDLDGPRHTRSQLVAITKELVTATAQNQL